MPVPDMPPSEPDGVVTLPGDMTRTLVADAAPGPAGAEWDADRAVALIYSEHYRSLVRLAAFLVRDTATAEEVVQDSFVAMHGAWRRLRDNDKALCYLRQSVVNRSRSVLRHQQVVGRNTLEPPPDMPGAEHGAILQLERSAVVAALRRLPGTAAGSAGVAVLRGPDRRPDRLGHGYQQGSGQDSHGPRYGSAAARLGAASMRRARKAARGPGRAK